MDAPPPPSAPAKLKPAHKRKDRVQCAATDRTGSQCRRYGINDTPFCGLHENMCGCTPDQLANATFCNGCHKQFYSNDVNPTTGKSYKQCGNCRTRGADNREIDRTVEAVMDIPKCEFGGCKNKGAHAKGSTVYDKYCGLHQRQHFVDDTVRLGLKLCYNYVRGCTTQLPTEYTRSKCAACLAVDREKDHARRGTA